MSYRVEYAQRSAGVSLRRIFLSIWCFLLFLVLVFQYWPEGAGIIRTMLADVEESTAVSALNRLAEELVQGEAVKQAFSDFLESVQS